jgi:spermidine/putrescine transport system permease protein
VESATATARPAISAGPIRAIRAAWAWVRRNGFKIYTGFALAYMLVPIAVIAVFSFADASENRDHLAFAINNGFTLKYWEHAFSIPDLNTALFTSFRLAALATLLSTIIGTLMAIALVRYRFHGRGAANLLLVLPMATPEIVMGASLLSLFLIYGVALGFTSLLIAHIMFCISFVVVVVRSRLIGFDRSIEDAAADLGATPIGTFRYVTLPLLRPGILAAALLAFALSVDDFIVSDFNKGTTETFPIYVFGAHLRGIPVQVNVLATMLFAVTVGAICFVLWQQRRAERLASVPPEQEV